jgi:hypothetical protein
MLIKPIHRAFDAVLDVRRQQNDVPHVHRSLARCPHTKRFQYCAGIRATVAAIRRPRRLG